MRIINAKRPLFLLACLMLLPSASLMARRKKTVYVVRKKRKNQGLRADLSKALACLAKTVHNYPIFSAAAIYACGFDQSLIRRYDGVPSIVITAVLLQDFTRNVLRHEG